MIPRDHPDVGGAVGLPRLDVVPNCCRATRPRDFARLGSAQRRSSRFRCRSPLASASLPDGCATTLPPVAGPGSTRRTPSPGITSTVMPHLSARLVIFLSRRAQSRSSQGISAILPSRRRLAIPFQSTLTSLSGTSDIDCFSYRDPLMPHYARDEQSAPTYRGRFREECHVRD